MVEHTFFKREHGRVETWPHKIIRHVLTGEFDPATIKRGIKYLHDYWRTEGIQKAEVSLLDKEEDFNASKGTTLFSYGLKYGPDGRETENNHSVSLVEFPTSSHLKILTVSEEKYSEYMARGVTSYSKILKELDARACFIGPTRNPAVNKFPNNGYFDKEQGLLAPFYDTHPVGQRRGALAITTDGEAKILEESEKLRARDQGFEGYEVVSGTSFYIKSSDVDNATEFFNDYDRSSVSYFIFFVDQSGNTRMGHLSITSQVTRVFIKKLLDLHSKNERWQSYIAAELELNSNGAFVLSDDKQHVEDISLSDSYPRRDLYLVF